MSAEFFDSFMDGCYTHKISWPLCETGNEEKPQNSDKYWQLSGRIKELHHFHGCTMQ